MTQHDDRLLTPQELADYLQIPLASITAWRGRGKGPTFIKVGKHVRYSVASVQQWLREQEAK